MANFEKIDYTRYFGKFEEKMITLYILASGAKIDYTRYSGFRGENRATDLLCDLRPKKPSDYYSEKCSEKMSVTRNQDRNKWLLGKTPSENDRLRPRRRAPTLEGRVTV